MRLIVLLVSALLITGCGYVGDPLPPALHIPEPVSDLSVFQRGDRLIIRFTAPALTTEQLGVRSFSRADVRIGPVPKPFSMQAWEASASGVPMSTPEPGATVSLEAPAGHWRGQEVMVAVRLVSTRGREGAWSNTVLLTPQSPLPVPAVKAALHPEGVRLQWEFTPETQYRVRRQGEGAEPVEIATVSAAEYIDTAVDLGRTYAYDVQAVAGPVESEVSAPVRLTVRDEFAPKPPVGVTAVVGSNSIELSWDRNVEPDLSGYRVYRAEEANAFTVLADAVEAVAFSDRQIEAGKSYRYRVTALDKSGNESEPSAMVEATTVQ